jgi:hypothetical protein
LSLVPGALTVALFALVGGVFAKSLGGGFGTGAAAGASGSLAVLGAAWFFEGVIAS